MIVCYFIESGKLISLVRLAVVLLYTLDSVWGFWNQRWATLGAKRGYRRWEAVSGKSNGEGSKVERTMMDEESFREAVGSLRGGLLITTKGAAVRHRVYKRRDWKERTISYFNQIISRTMGPTGEKSSFASCFDTGRSLPPPWNAMHGKSIVRTFVATLNRFYAIVQIYELWGKT